MPENRCQRIDSQFLGVDLALRLPRRKRAIKFHRYRHHIRRRLRRQPKRLCNLRGARRGLGETEKINAEDVGYKAIIGHKAKFILLQFNQNQRLCGRITCYVIFSCEKQKKLMSDRYCINSTTIKLFPQILRKDAQEVNFSKKLSCVKGQTHSIQNNSKITND